MSAEPKREFVADGIAEDIITALSRYPSLFVIERQSLIKPPQTRSSATPISARDPVCHRRAKELDP
jgi:TolB-like protein